MILFSRRKIIFRILLLLLSIPAAAVAAAAANDSSGSALEQLRRENAELRSRLLTQEQELNRMRQWLAGVVSGYSESGSGNNERLLARFNEVIRSGKALSLKCDEISKSLRRLLKDKMFSESVRIQYSMLLDELDERARSFTNIALRQDGKSADMRVIAVDNKLQIAVVSGGLQDGIFPGMMLYQVNSPESKLQLRVISVRPGACAVDLAGGEWKEVIPGMELTPFRKRN